MDDLQKALASWAIDYAHRYETLESGRQQGGPETWCGPEAVCDAFDDAAVYAAFQAVVDAAFRKAVG